jgi:hypothetical protein
MKKVLCLSALVIAGFCLYESSIIEDTYILKDEISSIHCEGKIKVYSNPYLDYIGYECNTGDFFDTTGFYLNKPYKYNKYGYFEITYNPDNKEVSTKFKSSMQELDFKNKDIAKRSINQIALNLLKRSDIYIGNKLEFESKKKDFNNS